MKTLKITEETHKQLLSLQSYIYTLEGIKFTFDELIAYGSALLLLDKKTKYEDKKNESK